MNTSEIESVPEPKAWSFTSEKFKKIEKNNDDDEDEDEDTHSQLFSKSKILGHKKYKKLEVEELFPN